MEVILKEEIRALGKAGEVIQVKPGYARNYLLPQGLAVIADPKNLKELEHHKRVVEAQLAKQKKEAEGAAEKIGALSLTIKKEAGEEEKLFGAVTVKDIIQALLKENLKIDRRQIHLASPIKTLGLHEVPVKLHPEITATLKVTIVKG